MKKIFYKNQIEEMLEYIKNNNILYVSFNSWSGEFILALK